MPGPELLRSIKAKYPQLPVLLITGLTGRLSQEIAHTAGADGGISKPFRNMEIIGQLRQLLARPGIASSPRPSP
jgi:CheY-like chemotaxis protein